MNHNATQFKSFIHTIKFYLADSVYRVLCSDSTNTSHLGLSFYIYSWVTETFIKVRNRKNQSLSTDASCQFGVKQSLYEIQKKKPSKFIIICEYN